MRVCQERNLPLPHIELNNTVYTLIYVLNVKIALAMSSETAQTEERGQKRHFSDRLTVHKWLRWLNFKVGLLLKIIMFFIVI